MRIIPLCPVLLVGAMLSTGVAAQAPRQLSAAVSFDVTAGVVHKAAFFKAATFRVPGGALTFTPNTLYFIAPASVGCSDAASGLTTSLAWCTPNHSVNCGDVLLASPGTYLGDMATWGTVSNCPSTTNGIDGTGGINVAMVLCAGSDIEACKIDCSVSACNGGNIGSGGRNAPAAAMNINKSNWGVSGWSVNGNASGFGYQMDACLTTTTIIHHIAVINSKVVNAGSGWDTADCGYGHAVPGNGTDYAAALGLIAQNASQASICVAAIDFVAPANSDSNSGTHTYIDTNYITFSQSAPCVAQFDSEAIMLDTLDAHGYSGQIMVTNNMAWRSMRYCMQVFYQLSSSSAPVIKIRNNTCYGNLTNTGNGFAEGEINFNTTGTTPAPNWVITLQNNIAQTDMATSGSPSTTLYALLVGGALWNLTDGGSGTENILKGLASSCVGSSCDAGNNQVSFNGNGLGTNTYTNPSFTNTTDLTTNWVGVPSCTGFVTTTACMGYNANTSVLTSLTPISDLTPTAGGMTGKGFQLPSITCAANADYPAWLKGLNVLRASGWTNGAVITEYPDLASKPCGL